MKIKTTLVLLAFAISVAGTLLKIENAAAQEQTIDCDDVPIAVRTAFQKAYPKATTQGCAQEVKSTRPPMKSRVLGKNQAGRSLLCGRDFDRC